jgi:uncharacterized protein YbjT (DUF2867 family)
MILVVGATGIVGGMVTRKLLEQGKAVRILVRANSPSEEMAQVGMATPALSLQEAGAEPVTGDLKDPGSLARAVEGVETVIATANSAMRGGDDNIQSVDLEGNHALIDAAKAAGVKHFIFVSALGAQPGSPVPLMDAKGRTEQYLRDSGMDHTILEPNVFTEVWVPMVVGQRVMAGEPVILMGEGRRRHTFISNEDVAAFAIAAVDNPAARNQTLPLGGPDALSWRDIVEIFERVVGEKVDVRYVAPGEPVPGLSDVVLGLMAAFETFDSPLDMTETARAFGIELTSVEDYVRRNFGGGGAI